MAIHVNNEVTSRNVFAYIKRIVLQDGQIARQCRIMT